MTWRFARRMARVKPNAIGELLRLGAEPGIRSFGGGYPDATLFPVAELASAFDQAIHQQGGTALQYTVSNGLPQLRQQVAARMQAQGIACVADNILILQGAQQGLDLVAKMLIDPDDVILTESPSFLGGLIAFDPCQPRYVGVRMDEFGMDMEALEREIHRNPRARLIYTIPDFQNPTGVTMSLARRQRLIQLANQHDLVILEDTPYRELRFEGEALPALKALDREGRVIFLGSFSKLLAPGLRLGWAVASEPLIAPLGLLKLAADTQCSTLNMAAVSLLLETFDLDAHVEVIRGTYRRKKQLMLDTIRRSFPQQVTATDPSGGMFTWLSFPEGFDAGRFMVERALPEARVAYVPGGSFYPDGRQLNHARVNFSNPPDAVIVEGMTALGTLLKRHL